MALVWLSLGNILTFDLLVIYYNKKGKRTTESHHDEHSGASFMHHFAKWDSSGMPSLEQNTYGRQTITCITP
jgi:hypothetical protein